MKKTLWLLCATALAFAACKKSTRNETPDAGDKPFEPRPGVVKPVGTPDGVFSTSRLIGPAGGTIYGPNGELTVSIPPGAIATEELISVKSISNSCPGSIGKAFRLLPEGIRFSKPVTITFTYEMPDTVYYIPRFTTVAYQDSAGVWQALTERTVDSVENTVTVQTDHFSDWTPLSGAKILVDQSVLAPNGQAHLQLKMFTELLAPLVRPGRKSVPLPDYQDLHPRYIREWILVGPGQLQPAGATATYKAPASISGLKAEASVFAVVVPNKTEPSIEVMAKIVIGKGFITYSADGAEKLTIPLGMARHRQPGKIVAHRFTGSRRLSNGTAGMAGRPGRAQLSGRPGYADHQRNIQQRLFVYIFPAYRRSAKITGIYQGAGERRLFHGNFPAEKSRITFQSPDHGAVKRDFHGTERGAVGPA